MQNMNWNYPTNVWFGVDRSKEIQKACDTLGIKNPLIVTDPGLLQTSIIDEINKAVDIPIISEKTEKAILEALWKVIKSVLLKKIGL